MRFIVCLVALFATLVSAQMGAFSQMKKIDDPALVDQFKSYQNVIQDKINREFETFEPKEYSSQVVAGMNYMIKYAIGDDKFITVQMYVPLPSSNELPKVKYVIDEKGVKTGATAVKIGALASVLAATYLLA